MHLFEKLEWQQKWNSNVGKSADLHVHHQNFKATTDLNIGMTRTVTINITTQWTITCYTNLLALLLEGLLLTGSQLVFLVPADAAPHAPSLAQPAPDVTEAGLPAPHRDAVASGVAACRAAAFFCFSLFSFSRRLASSSCISRKDLPAATPGDLITQIEQGKTVMGYWCADLIQHI